MSSSRDDFGIAVRSALLQRGAREKFSLFFLICLSILIFFLDSYPSKFMDRTRAILNYGIYRVSHLATSPFKFVSSLSDKTKNHFFVYKENIFLKNEIKKLEDKNLNILFLTTENRRLKEVLKTETSNDSDRVVAKVLIDKESPFLKSVILNKGSKSNIAKGMPVLSDNYLVGRVVEVNYMTSRVLLLKDLNSRIPVVIQSDGAQAILSGDGTKKPSLEYLPESYKATEDVFIFTSGKDGIFYPGIAVGKTLLEKEKVKVKLFSDPDQLSFVNIILTKEKTDF